MNPLKRQVSSSANGVSLLFQIDTDAGMLAQELPNVFLECGLIYLRGITRILKRLSGQISNCRQQRKGGKHLAFGNSRFESKLIQTAPHFSISGTIHRNYVLKMVDSTKSEIALAPLTIDRTPYTRICQQTITFMAQISSKSCERPKFTTEQNLI